MAESAAHTASAGMQALVASGPSAWLKLQLTRWPQECRPDLALQVQDSARDMVQTMQKCCPTTPGYPP